MRARERSRDVTAIAPDTETLSDLDAGTRQAWSTYSDRLRKLTGEKYESVECESWAELQDELRRLDRRRQALTAEPA
jgi:hypothetical protein